MKLNELTITQAREGLDKKEFTSVELTQACLEVIKEKNKELNAVLTVCEEEALAEAKSADKRIQKGQAEELTGIPYLAKDNYLTKGVRTTAASKILANYIAPYDATVITKLREAGAVLLGKTNMDEFAHGSSTENSAFGVTKNPHDQTRVAGGSSGGSAAAVAGNMCIFALGSDTGGSIRCPASYCGVVGLKPTYGRASRFGIIAMTSSTDVPGPITKTAEDSAVVLGVIAGHDHNDFTTTKNDVPNYSKEMKKDINPVKSRKTGIAPEAQSFNRVKVGVPMEFFVKGLDSQVEKSVRAYIKKLSEQGAEIKEVSLPHTKYAVTAYYIITPSEVSSNLGRYDGIRYGVSAGGKSDSLAELYKNNRALFGPEAKRRIMIGTYALSAGYYDAYYLRAQKVRTKVIQEFDQVFREIDVLITPTMPSAAFPIGKNKDPLEMYLEDIFTLSPSLAGLPAVSVPGGMVDNLPVGVQIIGKKFSESTILGIAHQVYVS